MIIHSKQGTCRTLCFDFDVAKGGLDTVLDDVKNLTQWLHEHGIRWVQDHSPNGGRHVYVPLETPLPFHLSKHLVEQIATRYKSIDPTPHQNIRHGCIRTPGATHKTGGHQKLEMSLWMATKVFQSPATESSVQNLLADIGPVVAEKTFEVDEIQVPRQNCATRGSLSRAMTLIATQGIYDTARYDSPSEARQAVLVASAGAGMTLLQIQHRMGDGTWPGLAQFYERYSAHARSNALRRDWVKAVKYAQSTSKKETVQKYYTSQPSTQGGLSNDLSNFDDDHQLVRSWRTAFRTLEHRYSSGKVGLSLRMILRSLGEAAHKTGSKTIEFGVRSLSIATGMDPSVVAAHLRRLRNEPDPLIRHTGEAQGTQADQYTLVIPEHIEETTRVITWRAGKIHALRPVFRELGLPAAFVYEALEYSPAAVHELVQITGIGRSTVHEALLVLSSWGLVEKTMTGWQISPTGNLSRLAEIFGVTEAVAKQVERIKEQRIIWRSWLAQRLAGTIMLPSPGDDYPWETFEGPPDDWTLSDIAFGRAA